MFYDIEYVVLFIVNSTKDFNQYFIYYKLFILRTVKIIFNIFHILSLL